jgi:uncharacterized damage-inducible protein DinB
MTPTPSHAPAATFTLTEMLAANEAETEHWLQWFQRQSSGTLDLPTSIAGAGTVRHLLLHIFAVELRYAERLLDRETTPYESLPTATVNDLFGIGERGRRLFREFLSKATSEELSRVIEFPTRTAGTLKASKRKCFIHANLHSVRHWAQMAVLLREAGHKTDWFHDFLFSPVMG